MSLVKLRSEIQCILGTYGVALTPRPNLENASPPTLQQQIELPVDLCVPFVYQFLDSLNHGIPTLPCLTQSEITSLDNAFGDSSTRIIGRLIADLTVAYESALVIHRRLPPKPESGDLSEFLASHGGARACVALFWASATHAESQQLLTRIEDVYRMIVAAIAAHRPEVGMLASSNEPRPQAEAAIAIEDVPATAARSVDASKKAILKCYRRDNEFIVELNNQQITVDASAYYLFEAMIAAYPDYIRVKDTLPEIRPYEVDRRLPRQLRKKDTRASAKETKAIWASEKGAGCRLLIDPISGQRRGH
jgi:hypothetical protein